MPAVTVQKAFELAQLHHQAGRLAEAEGLYRQILAIQPNHSWALQYLGVAAYQAGRHDAAAELIGRALDLDPNNAAAHTCLGEVYRSTGRLDEAITSYRRAIELNPEMPEAHNNLGLALAEQGHLDEALVCYRRALELNASLADVHNNLGLALVMKSRVDDAAFAGGKAGDCSHAIADENHGIDEAIAAYHRAIQLQTDFPEAHVNLGAVLAQTGQLDDAIAAYRRAHELRPDHAEYHSNVILMLHYQPDPGGRGVSTEQQRWNRQFETPAAPFIRPHRKDQHPDRRLRIGYVSPDFRDHAVGRNVLPLFRHHDPRNFEIICYSGVAKPDPLTVEFQKRAHQWRSTVGVDDETLAGIIRRDDIDILVDLTQHGAGNRLPLFARQPAPVQVSFAGYPASTGVEAIGYRISDRWLEGGASKIEDGRSEIGRRSGAELRSPNSDLRPAERVFLIDSFWCFDPYDVDVPVNELPATQDHRITFGSPHFLCKINETVLRLWARVMQAVKDSRLVVLSGRGRHRRQMIESLEQAGVSAARVEFVPPCRRTAYFEFYHSLDMILDSFPYGGHTTSLDALWMGVPVVSLAGTRATSRAGLSILNNLGLPELVASTEDDYVKIAAKLAANLPQLAELRRTLRSRMESSVLMDAPHFARQIETAYRAMWRQWCLREPA